MTTLTHEHQQAVRMIRDSATAVFPSRGSPARVRELRFRSPGHDPATYREMCALGWAGLRLDDAAGGSGLGVAELVAIAEALGAALVPEPILATAAIAPLFVGDALAPTRTEILSGQLIVAPAWAERVNGLDAALSTRFVDGRVDGVKRFVPSGGAQAFLVAAREGLALVRRDDPGVTVVEHFTQDGGVLAELRLDGAPGTAVPGNLEGALAELTLANAGVLLGTMDRMIEITLEYLATRRQFGQPIGSFQVLQHRMVDLKLQLDISRAVLAEAAAVLDGRTDNATRATAVSRASARLSEAAMTVAREAIQLHGAIGMTTSATSGCTRARCSPSTTASAVRRRTARATCGWAAPRRPTRRCRRVKGPPPSCRQTTTTGPTRRSAPTCASGWRPTTRPSCVIRPSGCTGATPRAGTTGCPRTAGLPRAGRASTAAWGCCRPSR